MVYELGRDSLPGRQEDLDEACRRAARGIEASSWRVRGMIHSPVSGGRGAREFFLHAARHPDGQGRSQG